MATGDVCEHWDMEMVWSYGNWLQQQRRTIKNQRLSTVKWCKVDLIQVNLLACWFTIDDQHWLIGDVEINESDRWRASRSEWIVVSDIRCTLITWRGSFNIRERESPLSELSSTRVSLQVPFIFSTMILCGVSRLTVKCFGPLNFPPSKRVLKMSSKGMSTFSLDRRWRIFSFWRLLNMCWSAVWIRIRISCNWPPTRNRPVSKRSPHRLRGRGVPKIVAGKTSLDRLCANSNVFFLQSMYHDE